MANIVKTYSFVNGQPADATQVNQNFDDIIAGVGDISAAGHALIDDASATAQLATLGAAAYTEGTWTPVLVDFTITGATPPMVGLWRRIGNIAFGQCNINAGTGGNTKIDTTAGVSHIDGFNVSPAENAPCSIIVAAGAMAGIITTSATIEILSTFAASGILYVSFTFTAVS